MNKIFIATSNQHKVTEFKALLPNYQIMSLKDLDENINIIETGSTFAENAIIKAETICKKYQIDVIADDSGIEVEALNNEPGIYSARYLGEQTDYKTKMNSLIKRLEGQNNRNCRYVCAIALARYQQPTKVFYGYCNGQVAYKIQPGEHGFGYDPMFYLPEYNLNMNQISETEKNKISHRYLALRKLLEYLNENDHK